jgi:hypothetical protein
MYGRELPPLERKDPASTEGVSGSIPKKSEWRMIWAR